MKRTEARFVVCVKNKGYAAALELRKLYQVVSDEEAAKLHQIRVIDESGEDYLYPQEYFIAGNFPNRRKKRLDGRPPSAADKESSSYGFPG
jgi:hypothetical protein